MDLTDLYQELILDHNKRPRNFGPMEEPDRIAHGNNPLCGDKLVIYVKLDGDQIEDVRFEGEGCAISTASASLLTQQVKGRTVAEAEGLFRRFHTMITGEDYAGDELDVELGKLEAFSGVGAYPARAKCATLSWHTLNAALGGEAETVTTE